MMGYFNNWSMMGGAVGFGGDVIWILVAIDLALLGIWLWQKISKK